MTASLSTARASLATRRTSPSRTSCAASPTNPRCPCVPVLPQHRTPRLPLQLLSSGFPLIAIRARIQEGIAIRSLKVCCIPKLEADMSCV